MDFEIIERQRQGKNITKKKTFSEEIKKSIYMLMFTLFAIILTLSITYLLNTTQSNQKGYELDQEQSRQEKLIIERDNVINKIIEVMSYKKLEQNPLLQKMLKPEVTEHIKPTPL